MVTWHPTDRGWSDRILAEYREMPGLCLTLPQAARLWALDTTRCRTLLDGLVAEGRLRRNARGEYCLQAIPAATRRAARCPACAAVA